MSRREQIKMSREEADAFLAEERTVTCATLGPRGWPHLMPLWYVLRESDDGLRLWAWTYASSQKVLNLERTSRATLQIEKGEQYQELRGLMLECDVVVHREPELVTALGLEIFERYASPRGEAPVADGLPAQVAAMIEQQAKKRVGLEFVERRRASWDHRKLGGVY